MAKERPCREPECPYLAMKGKQRCGWHWLATQSPATQRGNSQMRLDRASQPHRPRVPSDEWPAGERWCAGCQSFVPLFYCSGSRCKACSSGAAHAQRIEKTYGLTADEYDALLRQQGGRCAICGNQPRSMRLAVDHDHQSGEVRGLLCKRCNHDLLGGGHDSVDVLWRALRYLLSPPTASMSLGSTEVIEILRMHVTRLENQAPDPVPPSIEPPPF